MGKREPHVGNPAVTAFLGTWLARKKKLVLVTGRRSYVQCGAESFFLPFLRGKNVLHLETVGENARSEDVAAKQRLVADWGVPDAFVAVGGGTVIDTTKLLRGLDRLHPFLAVPTTAGTGAESTRFAVYYDQGKKKSADDVRYLPTDVVLLLDFLKTQSAYQRACTEFDAYAQAVESLWANGATNESRAYARRSLELHEQSQAADGESRHAFQLLASYWAGRAIDLSRTTAAHALSYYMTSHYGVPHGHAVYMMFPYVCRANGHPEFNRVIEELSTLREFAAEKSLDWDWLVGELMANVNAQRLSNNPCPIHAEDFYE